MFIVPQEWTLLHGEVDELHAFKCVWMRSLQRRLFVCESGTWKTHNEKESSIWRRGMYSIWKALVLVEVVESCTNERLVRYN